MDIGKIVIIMLSVYFSIVQITCQRYRTYRLFQSRTLSSYPSILLLRLVEKIFYKSMLLILRHFISLFYLNVDFGKMLVRCKYVK